MSAFNTQALVDKLSRLNSSQQSIETISAWCTFYRKDARKVVGVWETEFARAPNVQKKMALLYLANDILQNSRKKGPEYVQEFFRVLPRPLQQLLKHSDDKTCKAVERLVAIWEERRVFGASGAKPFKEIVASAPSPRKSHVPGAAPAAAAGAVRPAPALNGAGAGPTTGGLVALAAALAEASDAAARGAALAERCEQALPQSLEDVGGTEGAAAARTLLNERGVLLAREAAARARAIALLQGLLQREEGGQRRAQEAAAACRERLAQLERPPAPAPPDPNSVDLYDDVAMDIYSPGGGDDAWTPPLPPDPLAGTGPPQLAPVVQASSHGARAPPSGAPGGADAPDAPAARGGEYGAAAGGGDAAAAAVAAQLAASGGVSVLLEALSNMPQDMQQRIGVDLSNIIQLGESALVAGDDEYDPEQGGAY
ncbi:hypothetical protein WJX81_006004 [Elliptochloris bilobata]|uniref:CID domain-containing protein n=1 Tax=Elliptochloris bilobata TaxID=381761 RepID=A0AAW1QZE6_9CHLO